MKPERDFAADAVAEEGRRLEQAVKDACPHVAELAQVSKRLVGKTAFSPGYDADREHATELTSRIRLIAERIDVSTNGMIQLATAHLNRSARRGRGDGVPSTERVLNNALVAAIAAEAEAKEIMGRAIEAHAFAAEQLRAAEEAASRYCAAKVDA